MCTVTIILLRGERGPGFRLVTNRDEQRTRLKADPPAIREVGGSGKPPLRAVWPTDGAAGGTWIAANQRGLVLSLLNVNLAQATEQVRAAHGRERSSRGWIIPALADAENSLDAVERLMHMPLRTFPPFRLIAADLERVVECRWDGLLLGTTRHALEPLCFTSSGLGDDRVAPRLDLFREMIRERGAIPDTQDDFHRHSWPGKEPISVLMSREDARTVSTTVVEVAGDPDRTLRMAYRDDEGLRELILASGRERIPC